ncbi:MAG: hypothetical protein RIT81_12300 [Deltaproteobacteria bacterium]
MRPISVRELLGVGAVDRLARHRGEDELLELQRDGQVRRTLARRHEVGLPNLHHRRNEADVRVGGLQREDLVEDGAEPVDVGLGGEQLRAPLGRLGRHVLRRAGDRAARGLRRRELPDELDAPVLRFERVVAADDLGEAPVDQDRFTVLTDHDVRRLDVAVDDAVRMREGHCVGDLLVDREQADARELLLLRGVALVDRVEDVEQRDAAELLHHVEELAGREAADVVNRDDRRVLELPGRLDLGPEAADEVLGGVASAEEDLHGDLAADVGVAGLQDATHAAAPDLPVQLVALVDAFAGRGERFGGAHDLDVDGRVRERRDDRVAPDARHRGGFRIRPRRVRRRRRLGGRRYRRVDELADVTREAFGRIERAGVDHFDHAAVLRDAPRRVGARRAGAIPDLRRRTRLGRARRGRGDRLLVVDVEVGDRGVGGRRGVGRPIGLGADDLLAREIEPGVLVVLERVGARAREGLRRVVGLEELVDGRLVHGDAALEDLAVVIEGVLVERAGVDEAVPEAAIAGARGVHGGEHHVERYGLALDEEGGERTIFGAERHGVGRRVIPFHPLSRAASAPGKESGGPCSAFHRMTVLAGVALGALCAWLHAMNDLQPILLLLVAGAIIAAVFLWRRVAALETELRGAKGTIEDKRSELEKVRADTKKKSDDLDAARKELQTTKAKLKRQKKEAHAAGGKKSKNDNSAPAEVAETSAATVVTLSNSEVEAAHSKAMGELRTKLDKANKRIADMEAAESKRKAAAEKAAKAIRTGETAGEEVAAARTPEEKVEALEAQLEAFKRAAADREKKLSKQAKQAEERAKAASRRANGNRDSYQVLKGQLELAQDRLALLRRKYEGAKNPTEYAPPPAADDAENAAEAAAAIAAVTEDGGDAEAAPVAAEAAAVEADAASGSESESASGAEADAASASEAASASASEAGSGSESASGAEADAASEAGSGSDTASGSESASASGAEADAASASEAGSGSETASGSESASASEAASESEAASASEAATAEDTKPEQSL